MPSLDRRACQRRTLSACAITSIVLLVGLLFFVAIHLTLSWQDITGEDLTSYLNGDMHNDCKSEATVLSDEVTMQKWFTSANFSEAWSDAKENAREPVHKYMEKHHSIAIYIYTNTILKPGKQDLEPAESSGKPLKNIVEPYSLYFSLSEAIQILKHTQLTCLTTNYTTETLHLNISTKLIRFSTYILGSDAWNLTKNASCFQVHTCFGADITQYSAMKQSSQVLIPPYEVFKVTDTEMDTQRCKVSYRLKSNLNCVYDRERNHLHPISALPVDGFCLIFAFSCVIIVMLLLPFVIVKVFEHHKGKAVNIASSCHNSTY